MKKMMAGILTSIAAVCIGMTSIPAMAQGIGFTDSDGDGVCDNRTTGRGERNARRCMRGGKELCTVTVN